MTTKAGALRWVPGVEAEADGEQSSTQGRVADVRIVDRETRTPHLQTIMKISQTVGIPTRPLLVAFATLTVIAGLLLMWRPAPAQGAETCVGPECDSVALVDGQARFYLYAGLSSESATGSFHYGNVGDEPLMGDWNCDGVDTPAAYRRSVGLMYVRNSNLAGVADKSFYFGEPGDVPIAGDFNGDACDSIAIYRPTEGRVYVTNTLAPQTADFAFYFGIPGDQPFVGDFDGDGIDTVGVYRSSTGTVYLRNSNDQGVGNVEFAFGNPGDVLIAGDWDGDGVDTVAAYRPSDGTLYVKNDAVPGNADASFYVGAFRSIASATGITDDIVDAIEAEDAEYVEIDYVIDVTANPGDDLQELANDNPPGTVFLLNGTFSGQSVRPDDGQVFIGAPGAVMDGEGSAEYAFRSGASGVVIRGLEIRNYEGPIQFGAVHSEGPDWIVEDNEIHHNATVGVLVQEGSPIVRGNNIHHNHQLGLAVDYTENALVEDNEIAFNNYLDEYRWGFEAGGTKFWSSDNLTVRNNWSHDNRGPGLWSDNDNRGILYEGNLVEDNLANGIFHEISYDGVIRNNTLLRNGFGHDAWLWGAGIVLSTSGGVEVYGNYVEGNYNGITMVQQDRGSGDFGAHIVENNYVHDNVIVNSGISGAAEDIGSDAIFSANNRFEGNEYVGDVGWEWLGTLRSWSSWQGFGLDTTGSFR